MQIKHLLLAVVIATTLSCESKKDNTSSSPEITDIGAGEAPYLFTDNKGTVYLSWTEDKDEATVLKFAKRQNGKWSDPKIIASGSDWFVNWADYPIIVTPEGNNLLAHYLQKSADGTYTYDIMMRTSNDGGETWSEPFVLHNDGKKAEHGFVSAAPYGENYFVSWLDGRFTVADSLARDLHQHEDAMTLRAAILSPEGEKLEEWELDQRVCDCCQTSAVITESGPVIAYRDRSKEEIRDMSIIRLVDSSWTAPSALHDDNWKIAGCPVNGPRLAAKGSTLAAAWFTGADGKPAVKLKFSHDSGATFAEPIIVSEEMPVGRVDVMLIDEQTAMVSWMEGAQIMAVKITEKGEVLEKITVASSSTSRSSGFPQMTNTGDEVIFAWTDAEQQHIKVRSLSL